MFANFERHIDKHGECKFILAGESGKFNEERISGHLPMSYHLWYGRGAVAYFIFKVFQNLLAEWASVPRFLHLCHMQHSGLYNYLTMWLLLLSTLIVVGTFLILFYVCKIGLVGSLLLAPYIPIIIFKLIEAFSDGDRDKITMYLCIICLYPLFYFFGKFGWFGSLLTSIIGGLILAFIIIKAIDIADNIIFGIRDNADRRKSKKRRKEQEAEFNAHKDEIIELMNKAYNDNLDEKHIKSFRYGTESCNIAVTVAYYSDYEVYSDRGLYTRHYNLYDTDDARLLNDQVRNTLEFIRTSEKLLKQIDNLYQKSDHDYVRDWEYQPQSSKTPSFLITFDFGNRKDKKARKEQKYVIQSDEHINGLEQSIRNNICILKNRDASTSDYCKTLSRKYGLDESVISSCISYIRAGNCPKASWPLGLPLDAFEEMISYLSEMYNVNLFVEEQRRLYRNKPLVVYRNETNHYKLNFKSGKLESIFDC